MGKLIKIDKLSQLNSMYYYKVSTNDFIAKEFYIGINSQDKTILFYLTNAFVKPIKIVDLNKPDDEIVIPEIDIRLIWPTIGQARKAIIKNTFPEHLDYAV